MQGAEVAAAVHTEVSLPLFTVFLQTCTTLTLPEPVCQGSKCCAFHTRNLICMCRTLEVISWMAKLHRWETPGIRSVTHEMLVTGRQEEFSDIQIVNFALEEWSCRDHGLWPPAAYWKVMIELNKWQMALEFFNYPFAHYELFHPKLVRHRWELSRDWWWPLAEYSVLIWCCERFLGARQAPLAGILHPEVPVDSGQSS